MDDTWVRRSQSKVSSDGGGQNDGEYSKADHDHDLLLRSAKTHNDRLYKARYAYVPVTFLPWTVTLLGHFPRWCVCVHATRHPLLPLHIIVTFDPSIESRSYIRVPLCVSPATGLPILTIAVSCLVLYIYIYIFLLFLIFGSSPPRSCRIPSLSSYTIATKKTVHPSIVNIIIYLFFPFYIYIYFFHHTNTFFYLLFIYNLHEMSRRARWTRIWGGGYTDHHAIYLSIYPLSIRDSVFRLSFFEQERKGSETTNGRRVRAIPVRRNGFARVLTLRNVRSLGVFAVGGKRVGKGEGERRTRERSDEKRENAAARVSRKFHYFTLFPSWSTTLFTAFISFFHRFTWNPRISQIYLLTTRIPEWLWEWWTLLSGKLRWTSISANRIQRVAVTRRCLRIEAASKNERDRERESWKENGLCMFFSNRAKKKEKKPR